MRKTKDSKKPQRKFGKAANTRVAKTPSERRRAVKTHKELQEQNIGVLSKDKGIKTIYVGNLSYHKKPYDIKDMFKVYGEVSYVRLVMDKETHKSRGIAFVQMIDPESSRKAVKELNKKEVDGRTLKVSVAKENGFKTVRRR